MRNFLSKLQDWLEDLPMWLYYHQAVYTIVILLVDTVVGAICAFAIVKLIDWLR